MGVCLLLCYWRSFLYQGLPPIACIFLVLSGFLQTGALANCIALALPQSTN